MKLRLVAVVVLAVAGALAARAVLELRPATLPSPLPQPLRGIEIGVECPRERSDPYYFLATARFPISLTTRIHLPQLLRSAGAAPLWCGQDFSTVYRVTLLLAEGRSKIITAWWLDGEWELEAIEFADSGVGPFAVHRRVTKRLSQSEKALFLSVLHGLRFWSLEPVIRAEHCTEDAPIWVFEVRAEGEASYHITERRCDTEFKDAGRRLLELGGLASEHITPPQKP